MKICKLYLVIVILMLSNPFTKANSEIPRGIDLGEYAFGIPISELSLHENVCNFTLSFWMNPKEFIQTSGGTLFVNIRYVNDMWPLCDWGYFWSVINHLHSEFDLRTEFSKPDWLNIDKELLTFNTSEWKYFTFVFSDVNDSYTNMALYVNGSYLGAIEGNYSISLKGNELIMIGGSNFSSFPLNAYVDKVQFYNKALSQTEVEESMMTPLLNDESLLGFWDFEDGCTTDADGYMISENGTIKATMYKILELEEDPYYYRTIGAEIKPFVFGEGVDPESVIQGVEKSITEVNKSKAFVSNEMLNIENAEGINSVVVYNAMGKVITSANANGATSTQIALPSTIKGVLIVKVNSEVIKVINKRRE